MGMFRLRAERPKTTSRLADDAASVLEERGLARFVLEDGGGSMCLMGALNQADHGHRNYTYDAGHRRVMAVGWRVSGGCLPWEWSNAQQDHRPHVNRLRDVARSAREEEFAAARARAMGGPFARARQVESARPGRRAIEAPREPLAIEDGSRGAADVIDAPWFRDEGREVAAVGGGLQDWMA